MLVLTVSFLLFSKDKKWKTPQDDDADPDTYFGDDATKNKTIERKTVIFVRHGESTWNDSFNRAGRPVVGFVLYFVPNLVKAAMVEWYFWISGQDNESWFYDSPLSEKGLKQALGIRSYLNTSLEYATPKEAAMIRLLTGSGGGDAKKSQLVSSNLRRAISTVLVGFQDRLAKRYEKVSNDGTDTGRGSAIVDSICFCVLIASTVSKYRAYQYIISCTRTTF